MDSILEKHLKKAFGKKVKTPLIDAQKIVKKTKSKSDPILEKHLAKIFVENETISLKIKEAIEIKKKNEELLNAFTNVINKKIIEPIIQEEIVQDNSNTETIILDEISDVNKNIVVPEKEKELRPSIIDAYKSSIQKLPPSIDFQNAEDISKQEVTPDVVVEPEIKSEPMTAQDMYVQSIKDSEESIPISDIEQSDNDFFSFLDRNKDNPKLKNFFNTHSESMKKEILKISENFTKEKMLIASESGGGSGNVTITNSIQDRGKFVGLIGNGVDTEYTIIHNLGTKDSVITVYDAFTDELVITSASHLNENETKFSFINPIAFNSIKVVIIS